MIEAMKQALDALEDGDYWEKQEAITSLRQAIAEAEKQEPFGIFQYDIRLDAWVQNRSSDKGVAFYTHPQPKREWVGLTVDEFYDLDDVGRLMILQYGRSVEAKLKEKNS